MPKRSVHGAPTNRNDPDVADAHWLEANASAREMWLAGLHWEITNMQPVGSTLMVAKVQGTPHGSAPFGMFLETTKQNAAALTAAAAGGAASVPITAQSGFDTVTYT